MHYCLHFYPGARESAINRAEGLRQSKILASEAVRIEQLNKAKGQYRPTRLSVIWPSLLISQWGSYVRAVSENS